MSIFLISCLEPEIEPDSPNPTDPLPNLSCSSFVIEGYSNKQSFLPGETIKLYIKGNSDIERCALHILDYKNNIAYAVTSSIFEQAIKNPDPSSNGFGYEKTVEFKIPDLISGIYTIEGKIPFVVKPKENVDILVVHATNTANAYANSGGKSLYNSDRATEVSFLRPIGMEEFSQPGLNWFQSLQSNKVGFICDADLQDFTTLNKAKILAIIGHNEYWTKAARKNFDRFINEGNDALILSGNTMWWQVRYSEDLSKMICYKDSNQDPNQDPLLKTITWIQESLGYHTIESIGQDFERGGYGLKNDSGWNGFKIITPNSPLLEGTGLKEGDVISCPTFEYDGAPLSHFDVRGYPVLDLNKLGAFQGEIIAFDKGFRIRETYGTFIVYQRNENSGIIVNCGSTDWCSSNGMGGISGNQIQRITSNAIHKLLNNQEIFSK